MKKQKTKDNRSQASKNNALITQQDRATNPIFKTISNRIRNLNKKLTHIHALQSQEPAILKPQQIKKINSKEQVEADIAKNQQFAQFYKNLLIENGGIAFDMSDQIMKIATLLAVGWHKSTHQGKGKIGKHLGQALGDYGKIVGANWQKNTSVSDAVANIFLVLNQYLGKSSEYSACKDYISDVSELEESGMQPQQQEKVKQVKVQEKVEEKSQKAVEAVKEENKHAKEHKQEHKKQEQPKTEPKKQQPKPQPQQEQHKPEPKQEPVIPAPPPQQKNTQSAPQPKNQTPTFEQPTQQKTQQNPQTAQRRQKVNNRNYNKNYRNPQDRNPQEHYQPKNPNNQYRAKREYQNKKYQQQTKRQQSRSDTSLESTPEKFKPKKPKYIQKV